MISSQAKPEAPKKKAQALYDFQGQTEKELNFVKVSIQPHHLLVVMRVSS